MVDLLLELFGEEIPSSVQKEVEKSFKKLFNDFLVYYGIKFRAIEIHTSPRRITFIVYDIEEFIILPETQVKGPRIDSVSAALEGFCQRYNITKSDLEIVREQEKEFFIYNKPQEKIATQEILLKVIPEILDKYNWPKSMYWDGKIKWIRPLRNILCLFGNEVLPIKFGVLTANNHTFGHRFLDDNNTIIITDTSEYQQILREHYVISDRNERMALIKQQLESISAQYNLIVLEDQDLLEEVVGLVEYPNVMIGHIKYRYLQLPNIVVSTAMRRHQKYFSVLDQDKKFAPYFLFVSNVLEDKTSIIKGNELVLAARLEDALYFYNQDIKITLLEQSQGLNKLVFHAKLGTLKDKLIRVEQICYYLSPDNQLLIQAAKIYKSDLLSQMVNEFPELQGIMGYEYATLEGLDPQVALAIREHYKPNGVDDNTPSALAAFLAIADKVDSLVGLMFAGERATSSKDPYALRRQALGIIRIILDNKLRINLAQLVQISLNTYLTNGIMNDTVLDSKKSLALQDEIVDFIIERAKFYFKNYYEYTLVSAILKYFKNDYDLLLIEQKLDILKMFLPTEDGQAILATYKRIANIISASSKNNSVNYSVVIRELFTSQEERNLADIINIVNEKFYHTASNQNEFILNLSYLQELVIPIRQFFDNVMVNVSDSRIAYNRLSLLDSARKLFDNCFDFNAF